jgi:hypothetical protein
VVPIIDVLFKRDDLGTGHRLRLLELVEQPVGGRAIGATLGREKFDDH